MLYTKSHIDTHRNYSRNAECKTIQILHCHLRYTLCYHDRYSYASTPHTCEQSALLLMTRLCLLYHGSLVQILQIVSDGTMCPSLLPNNSPKLLNAFCHL